MTPAHLVASLRGGAVHARDWTPSLAPDRLAVQVAMPEDGGHVHVEGLEASKP